MAQKALNALESPDVELSIVITSDDNMRKLNRTWRERDYATDVLSFPMQGSGVGDGVSEMQTILGDVVINGDAAERQAEQQAVSFEEEMTRLLVHGVVHLMGYDHELGRTEAARMSAVERRVLRALRNE